MVEPLAYHESIPPGFFRGGFPAIRRLVMAPPFLIYELY